MTPNEAKLIELVLSDSAYEDQLRDAKNAVLVERVSPTVDREVRRYLENYKARADQNKRDWDDLVARFGLNTVEVARHLIREQQHLA